MLTVGRIRIKTFLINNCRAKLAMFCKINRFNREEMMKVLKCLVLLCVVCSFGCASIISGTAPQNIAIKSEPEGADISIVNAYTKDTLAKAKAPYIATLDRTHEGTNPAKYNVLLTMNGYMPEEAPITAGTTGWAWGNCLFGLAGIPMLLIDAASGAWYTLDTEPIKVTLYPNTADGRLKKAAEQFNGSKELNANNFDAAIKATSRGIEICPEYVEGYCNRSIAHASQGKYDLALLDINKADSVKPNHPMTYYARGVLYYKQGKYADALAEYNKALALDPDLKQAILERGRVNSRMGNAQQASADAKLACSKGYSKACNVFF